MSDFFISDLPHFFSDLDSGARKKKSSENDQLTGHFFKNISRTNSKTCRLNLQSVLDL